ncbi:hypothetical protein AMAG_18809 [Allomyces macrogynus ATCC 38327]|uniref:Uncharacterized protein n=1 Tax=Allomyces macrogynus (strain ATCC 38327) TaxID=578462 RepID=A0A0L0SI15_ALLM3|nr:hypothetical protein AMAG_18809 [Allomyces macrogynus ATCC 38327]|eukprot:KNE62097.1 hypothetical protein AMAG_18809 [Allomyces macrogynus ATCC 38327]
MIFQPVVVSAPPCCKLQLLDLPDEVLYLIAQYAVYVEFDREGAGNHSNLDTNGDLKTESVLASFPNVANRRTFVALRNTCCAWRRITSTISSHLDLSLDVKLWSLALSHFEIGPSRHGVSWSPILDLEEHTGNLLPVRCTMLATTISVTLGNYQKLKIPTGAVSSIRLRQDHGEDLENAHLGLSTILARMAVRFQNLTVFEVDTVLPAPALVLALGILSPTLQALSIAVFGEWNNVAAMLTLPRLRKLNLVLQGLDGELQMLPTAPRLKSLHCRANKVHPNLIDHLAAKVWFLRQITLHGQVVKMVKCGAPSQLSTMSPSSLSVLRSVRSLNVSKPVLAHLLAGWHEPHFLHLDSLTIFGGVRNCTPLPHELFWMTPRLTHAKFDQMSVPFKFFVDLSQAAPHLLQLDVTQCWIHYDNVFCHQLTFPALNRLCIVGSAVAKFFCQHVVAPALAAVEFDMERRAGPVPVLPWLTLQEVTLRATKASILESMLINGANLDDLHQLKNLNLLHHPVAWTHVPPVLNSVMSLAAPSAVLLKLFADDFACSNLKSLTATSKDVLSAVPSSAPLRRVSAHAVSPLVLERLSRIRTLKTMDVQSIVPHRSVGLLTLEYHSSSELWRVLPHTVVNLRIADGYVVRVGHVDQDVEAVVREIMAVATWALGFKTVSLYSNSANQTPQVVTIWGEWTKPVPGRDAFPFTVVVDGHDALVKRLAEELGKLNPKRVNANVVRSDQEGSAKRWAMMLASMLHRL